MNESAPQFDNATTRPSGKLAFGRDINQSIDDAQRGGRGVLPPEIPPGSFGHGDGSAWSRVYLGKVTGDETGGGKYKATLYDVANTSGTSISDPAANLEEDAIDASPKIDDNAVFINLVEYGAGTHDLTGSNELTPYFIGLLIEHTDDGRMVVAGLAFAVASCSDSLTRRTPNAPYYYTEVAYTITTSDEVVDANGTLTLTLPPAAGLAGLPYTIKNSGVGVVTLAADGSELIDGSNTVAILAGDSLDIRGTGTGWIVV